jgi:dTDP-4-amino-4,6-dideoxygalactose transaminase
MISSPKRYLSAYFTLPPMSVFAKGSDAWKEVFPFTDPGGAWTFSGRVALFSGLRQIQLRPGSTVLVPSYFQGTEIDTLIAAGYKLRFYAIDDNFEVDLSDVEQKLDEDVSALYIIHYFGLPQRLGLISAFCQQKGIKLIEDCALSFLSKEGDTWLGSRGDIALFSIYKSVSLPHGGYVVTKNPAQPPELQSPPLFSTLLQTADLVAQHVRGASAHGIINRIWNRTNELRKGIADKTVVSGTITLDQKTLCYSASKIVPHLMRLVDPKRVIEQRRANFALLHGKLRHLSALSIETLADGACPLFYPIYVENKPRFRDELMRRGLGSVNLWSQPHPASPCEKWGRVAKWRSTVLELPIHQQLDGDDVERVAREVLHLTRRPTAQKPASRASVSIAG